MPEADEIEVFGVIANDTPAQVQSLYSGNTLTPTADFNFNWGGQVLQFTHGVTAEVEPALLAALTAAGAPFGQP